MEISPNAFATELSRIIAANIGQRYLIIKLKIFFLRKVPPSATTSSSIFSTPTFLEIKRQVASAAIGIITELVTDGMIQDWYLFPVYVAVVTHLNLFRSLWNFVVYPKLTVQ